MASYIVEIATTGTSGYPKDVVVQIGICRLSDDFSDYDSVYDATIAVDPKDLGHDALDRIDSVYGISPESLYFGEDINKVSGDVRTILSGGDCISFDKVTFARFLCFEPWDLNHIVTFMPAISLMIPDGSFESDTPLSIHEVYSRLCPDDPANIQSGKNALDMAQMSSCIVIEMRKKGFY